MPVTVWRHVDKTGPEGNIDAFLQHGQGEFVIELLTLMLTHYNFLTKIRKLSPRCGVGGGQWPHSALLGDKCWRFELGGCAGLRQVIISLTGSGYVQNFSYLDQMWTVLVIHCSFQSACFVGQQDTAKHVAVLKKTAISLHYLSNGHQKWIENLPERQVVLCFVIWHIYCIMFISPSFSYTLKVLR